MTDKSIKKELKLSAWIVQLRSYWNRFVMAGLPRKLNLKILSPLNKQNALINHLKKVHGQYAGNAGQITLKRKTTKYTAKVASTSGKAKTIST